MPTLSDLPDIIPREAVLGNTLTRLMQVGGPLTPYVGGGQGFVNLSDLVDIPESKVGAALGLASMLPMGKATKALKGKGKQITKSVQEGMDWFAANYPELWKLARVQHGTKPMYRADLGEVQIPIHENLGTLDTIEKLAHEFQHAEQAAKKVAYTEPKVGPWVSHEAYRAHPSEVGSRDFAESVKQAYLKSLSPAQRFNALGGRPLDTPIPAEILNELK